MKSCRMETGSEPILRHSGRERIKSQNGTQGCLTGPAECSKLQEGGADLTIKIDIKTIVTAAWTVYRCRFGCNTYGKSHCCPPNAPTWKETQEIIDCFDYGILFRCHEMSLVTLLAVVHVVNVKNAIHKIVISRIKQYRQWKPVALMCLPQ